MDKKELKKTANTLKPTITIGKEGISENLLENLEKNLKKNEICKIKVLNEESKEKRDGIIDEILSKTKAQLVDRKGFTFTIFKEKRK